MTELTISNEALASFFKNQSQFSKNLEILDRVSSDIKAVENHLKENGISKSLRMITSTSTDTQRELICWDDYGNQGMRLIYERQYWTDFDSWKVSEYRPLIEAKGHIRIKMLNDMTSFLSMLQEQSGLPNPKETWSQSDIREQIDIVEEITFGEIPF
jgi:hypothetical protein